MAYDSLKGIIRQYIKTNGQNEITGQILQNVLIEMVNNYPSLDGYATQQWVGNGYLPLTGGTLTGTLYGTIINASNIICQGSQGHAQWGVAISTSGISVFSQDSDPLEPTIETTIGYGTVTASGAVTAASFIKSGGTSSQFLKADGSVDSNAYITSAALSGYATQQWVQNQGYITSSALSGYATESWVGLNYLPLSGGNLTGSLSILDTLTINASSLYWDDEGEWCSLTFDMDGITVNAYGTGYIIANQFIKNNGTSSQFLKADGSVDSNAYITSAALSGYATQQWVQNQGYITSSALSGYATESWVQNQGYITSSALSGYATESWVGQNYLPLSGGTLTGTLYGTIINASNIICQGSQGHAQWGVAISTSGISVFSQDSDPLEPTIETTIGYGTVTASGAVTAASFIKSGGTSSQFLKADGSVDSNAYITSAALSGYATESWVQQQGYITSAALSGYATESWVQQQGYITSSELSDYLPLTGGTLTGALTVSDPRSGGASALINLFGAFKSSGVNAVSSFNATFDYSGIIFKQTPMGGSEVTKVAINASGTITATGSVTSGSFVKSGGTSSQFLKADGSVDSNAYITSAALSGYATETWVGNNFLSLSSGGEVDGLLVANDYIQTAKVYGFDNETLLIQGSDTDGVVQIDAASGIFLTTDGNSSWIFCEDICCMDSQNKWKIAMSGNAYFKNLYLYDLNISEGMAGYATKYLCVKNGVLKFFDGTNEKTVVLQ